MGFFALKIGIFRHKKSIFAQTKTIFMKVSKIFCCLTSLFLLFSTSVYAWDYPVPVHKGRIDHIYNPICKQASFICEKHLVCLSNDGHAKAYPLFQTTDSVLFDLDCAKYQPHCNVANLVRTKGKNYLYVSEWNNERRFFVEDIQYSPETNSWNTRLIQTMRIDIPDNVSGGGYMDWIVDAKNKKVYTHAYTDAFDHNDRIGTGVIILEFPLPDPSAGDVTFYEKDILRRMVLPMIYVTQDKEIFKKKMYITAGLRTGKKNWDGSRKVVVIDLKRWKVAEEIDLSFHNDEPEGIDFWHGKPLLTYRTGCYHFSW